VVGCTDDELLAYFYQYGPLAGTEHAVAITWGQLSYTYELKPTASSCSIKSATIKLDLVIDMPELATSQGMDPNTRQAWQIYLREVKRHEDGHVEIFRRYARQLQTALTTMSSRASCEALTKDMHAKAAANQQALERAQDAYEKGEKARVLPAGSMFR
jgi:predicted secreted Zn-dependent protease